MRLQIPITNLDQLKEGEKYNLIFTLNLVNGKSQDELYERSVLSFENTSNTTHIYQFFENEENRSKKIWLRKEDIIELIRDKKIWR